MSDRPRTSPARHDPGDNVYLGQVSTVLPRLLALFDDDPTDTTYGIGDRRYWAWKLADFGNGTYQGAAHGLAVLLAQGLLPDWLPERAVLRRIEALMAGTDRLRRRDGSLEEAFPYESSFCVTAAVAFDLLSAIELLGDRLDGPVRVRYLTVVRPMIRFLSGANETHGFISNHLAAAAAALYAWHRTSGEPLPKRGQEIMARLLGGQSTEGWFPEYQGADPGYQSLCTWYLAEVHRHHPELKLLDPLRQSMQFLWHFAHPDGSFGGHYGSRNTRLYYPAGIEMLASEVPAAAALASHMRRSVREHRTVVLDAVDEPNLVPMFNAYCRSAAVLDGRDRREEDVVVPSSRPDALRAVFQEAGLVVDGGPRHYTVVSIHKGGVCYHYRKDAPGINVDMGVVVRAPDGALYSTQAYDPTASVEVESDRVVIVARLRLLRKPLPTPTAFLLLRLLNLTVLRWPPFKALIKQLLVRHLITATRRPVAQNRRTVVLGPDLRIDDSFEDGTAGLTRVATPPRFSAMHMASQGYWQRGDDAG